MKTDELREKYLVFFESKGHTRQASDVLVPTWDSSVLFTPAGMNQFKDHFLGKVKLDFTRATTCQKCLRTGDIENVGRTAYHHTFFEMLGNFSFGDYFKRDAIHWAWEFCTGKKWLGIDPKRLTVTVYVDDDEAADIWSNEVGLASSRIERMGESDNFWPASAPSQGPDGVCGPCSEIFYHDDFGDSVEIWNLVFTQFNRVGDPPDNLRSLPSKNIDTGMGLERTAATLQGVETNYHIDILRPIVEAAAEVCGLKYVSDSESGRRLRRITDHVRACAFAIHENVYPGAQKEKYVVRRLLRRAVLDGHQLGKREPFLFELVPEVVEMMRAGYPELVDTVERVKQVIQQEEQTFFATIDGGLARVEKIFADMESAGRVVVDGQEAAELYSTYGLPPELVESMAAERNFTFDTEGFQKAMVQHGIESGKAKFELFKTGPIEALKRALHTTEFVGYDRLECSCELKGIVAQNQLCDQVTEIGRQQPITLVLDRSPFYGESGGQVGDAGQIVGDGFEFDVTDTKRDGDLLLHIGHLVSGELAAGAKATARVTDERRSGIRRAHSATHILHYALQKNLGTHAQQQGSKVDYDWLRFDFTNMEPVSVSQLETIEKDVCQKINEQQPVEWSYVPLAEARKAGAMMLFGEKYPDPVRLVRMGEFSRELCGGTHVSNTGEVSSFEIVSEEAVAAGTRRVVALTGKKAVEHAEQVTNALKQTAELLGCQPIEVLHRVGSLAAETRDLKKQLASGGAKSEQATPPVTKSPALGEASYEQLRAVLRDAARALNVAMTDVPQRVSAALTELSSLKGQVTKLESGGRASVESLLEVAQQQGDVHIVVSETPGANPNLMRQLIDQLRKKLDNTAVMLATTQGDGRVVLVAGISKGLVSKGLSADKWVKLAAKVVGGGGGGRPDMAQAGGKDPNKLPEAIDLARKTMVDWLAG
jgi:alanyl-tRNA synthetase